MGKFVDLSGMRFGRLLVKAIYSKTSQQVNRIRYVCICDCGNECIVRANNLTSGNTQSCGCLHSENLTGMYKPNANRLYNSWRAMKARCFNQNNNRFHLYGGRGITVCDDWMSFENFKSWALDNGFSEELTIDRIDPDGNYCPENCRWLHPSKQSASRRCAQRGKQAQCNQV